jgi:hypothetical protein
MGLQKQVKKQIKWIRKFERAVANTQPITWARLSNDLKGYRRYFKTPEKFWEMYNKIEEAFKWTTSSTLAGERKVWTWLKEGLEDGRIVPAELYEPTKRALEILKDAYLDLQGEVRQPLAETKAELQSKGARLTKPKKLLNERLLAQMIRDKEYFRNGKPNWTQYGKILRCDPETVKGRARERGLYSE